MFENDLLADTVTVSNIGRHMLEIDAWVCTRCPARPLAAALRPIGPCDMLGYRQSEPLRTNVQGWVHPDELEEVLRRLDLLKQGEIP